MTKIKSPKSAGNNENAISRTHAQFVQVENTEIIDGID